MAKTRLTNEFELTLKDKYTKADCTVSLLVDAKSLPTMAVLGEAMEAAIAVIEEKIKLSYEVVPPRPIQPPVPVQPAQPMQPAQPAGVAGQFDGDGDGDGTGKPKPWALK